MSPNTETRAEQVVERLDVVRHARHETPDRVLVVVAQVQALQLLEDFGAEVVHHRLTEPGRDDRLRVLQHDPEKDRRQEAPCQEREVLSVLPRYSLIENQLREPRPDDLCR